jgi:copper resistance protein D
MYLFAVWIHVLAAAVWVGGMAFFVLVLVPVLRNPALHGHAPAFVREAGMRFRTVAWTALVILFVTGWIQMGYRGIGWGDVLTLDPPHAVANALRWKIVLFAVTLALSTVHDFFVGPRATEAWKREPDAPRTQALRKAAGWFGRLNAVLALAIVYLAALIVRGGC